LQRSRTGWIRCLVMERLNQFLAPIGKKEHSEVGDCAFGTQRDQMAVLSKGKYLGSVSGLDSVGSSRCCFDADLEA
jgi:hypothetical protein